jgi:hypothetical protein
MGRKWRHGRRYLHIDVWDGKEIWFKKPTWLPTLTVEVREDTEGLWQHTWTYLRSGNIVPPPGKGWQQYQQVDGSTEWRRPH